jgi:hypothetical protein
MSKLEIKWQRAHSLGRADHFCAYAHHVCIGEVFRESTACQTTNRWNWSLNFGDARTVGQSVRRHVAMLTVVGHYLGYLNDLAEDGLSYGLSERVIA